MSEQKTGGSRTAIGLILVLLLISGGAFALWWTGALDPFLEKKPAEQQPTAIEPLYYLVDPMIVNVSKANEYNHYLKIRPVLVVMGPEAYEQVKKDSPLIRNTLLSLYSRQTVRSLLAEDGYETLRKKTLEALQKINGAASAASIREVMFNEFVIQ